MAKRVRQIASALIELGVGPGDRVCIMSSTCAEWIEADFGILAAGAVSVPIYPSNTAEECGFIFWNAGVRFVFVENAALLARLRELQKEGFVLPEVEIPQTDDETPRPVPGDRLAPKLDRIILIDGEGDGAPDVLTFDALLALGSQVRERQESLLRGVRADTKPEDLATIVYTSGTTGPPKGVMQTHGNHLSILEMVKEDAGVFQEGDVDFLFLPLAHSFARLQEFSAIHMGSTTAIARSLETVLEDLAATRPQVIPAVPRVYEKIYTRIQGQAASTPAKRRVFRWAVGVGRAVSKLVQSGQPVPFTLELQRKLAHKLVFAKLHEKLGGRVKYFVSGGAPLSAEVAEFFHAAGLLILEGYGLTETTPALCINRPSKYRFGTVGVAFSQVQLQLAEDGELLAKGPNIAQGYYKRPIATAEAWDQDGWFHTGDIVEISDDGFVRIVDRKKELIITAGGKNIAPQNVENVLKTSTFISQAMLYGDRKPYCVVVVTLSPDEILAWAAQNGKEGATVEELSDDLEVRVLIEREIEDRKNRLARYESPKKFAIVYPDFSTETGELTPSMKLKRRRVLERHGDTIERLYRD
jgi:long-chain acyl-CoA synthetase